VKPINPSEAKAAALKAIPDEVIQAVNELIVENFSTGTITIAQSEIKQRAKSLMYPNLEDPQKGNFESRWLDFEDIFRQNGWKVEYDRPAYYENYQPLFRFSTP
jgi:hypothetical protein